LALLKLESDLMSHISYVNGRYLPHSRAMVHIEDRGYQFADGVYEVCIVRDGVLIDETRHLRRLARSLSELEIRLPVHSSALGVILREVIRRNRVRDGVVYLQVTRGVAPRNHPFPSPAVRPSLVVTARPADAAAGDKAAEEGIAVVTTPDNRWERVDIKTVGLLPNVLAKQKAKVAGAAEAWFVDQDGNVTEGSSTNAWIVTEAGTLVTHGIDNSILRGVTRDVVLDLLATEGLRVEERRFSVSEALAAKEAFVTSAGNLIMPVIRIDGRAVGTGRPGDLALKLRRLFFRHAERSSKTAFGQPLANGKNIADK
jgi:D-alanine transaminase